MQRRLGRLKSLCSPRLQLRSPDVRAYTVRAVAVLFGSHRLPFTGGNGDLKGMTERRYTDEESTTIFQLAAEGSSTLPDHPSHSDGLTLADLKSVGLDVGTSPDAIAHPAQTLEVRRPRSSTCAPTCSNNAARIRASVAE